MRRPDCFDRVVAYHEAGHAVASWRLGDGIGSVTIDPGRRPQDDEGYEGLFVPPRGDRSARSGWGHRFAVVLMAGAAAQRLHSPRSSVPHCARIDQRLACDLAAVMCRSAEAQSAFLGWAKAEARALIKQDWHLVELLAARLLTDRTLDGEAATALLAKTDADTWARVREAVARLTPRDYEQAEVTAIVERRRARPVTRAKVARSALRILAEAGSAGRETVSIVDLARSIALDLDSHGHDEAVAAEKVSTILGGLRSAA